MLAPCWPLAGPLLAPLLPMLAHGQGYAVRRFADEANRLYGVLNNRLYDRPYLAGNEYTIADMISYPWTVNWRAQGHDLEEFPHFKRWFEEIAKRPAVQHGMAAAKIYQPTFPNCRKRSSYASESCCTTSAPVPLQDSRSARVGSRGPGLDRPSDGRRLGLAASQVLRD